MNVRMHMYVCTYIHHREADGYSQKFVSTVHTYVHTYICTYNTYINNVTHFGLCFSLKRYFQLFNFVLGQFQVCGLIMHNTTKNNNIYICASEYMQQRKQQSHTITEVHKYRTYVALCTVCRYSMYVHMYRIVQDIMTMIIIVQTYIRIYESTYVRICR